MESRRYLPPVTPDILFMQPQKWLSFAVALLLSFPLFAFGIFSSRAAVFTYSVRQFKDICGVKSLLTS